VRHVAPREPAPGGASRAGAARRSFGPRPGRAAPPRRARWRTRRVHRRGPARGPARVELAPEPRAPGAGAPHDVEEHVEHVARLRRRPSAGARRSTRARAPRAPGVAILSGRQVRRLRGARALRRAARDARRRGAPGTRGRRSSRLRVEARWARSASAGRRGGRARGAEAVEEPPLGERLRGSRSASWNVAAKLHSVESKLFLLSPGRAIVPQASSRRRAKESCRSCTNARGLKSG